jgi:hypothetical protein
MRLRTIAKFGVLLLGILTIAATLSVGWSYFNVTQRLAGSSIARWWRCQTVEYPNLAASSIPWALTYSWSGGLGPGDVTLVLNSDGSVTLTASKHGQPAPLVVDYNVPKQEITRVARAVDDAGLLCLAVYPREGYVVWDLGRFSVSVTSGKFSRTVFVDECHTVADPAALFEVPKTLYGLAPTLDESISWGPYGTATVPAENLRRQRANAKRDPDRRSSAQTALRGGAASATTRGCVLGTASRIPPPSLV